MPCRFQGRCGGPYFRDRGSQWGDTTQSHNQGSLPGHLEPGSHCGGHNGNVFFADYNDEGPANGQTIKEILAVGGSIPASPTVVQLGSGFSSPNGLAVDKNGNVHVADGERNFISLLPAASTLEQWSLRRGSSVDPWRISHLREKEDLAGLRAYCRSLNCKQKNAPRDRGHLCLCAEHGRILTWGDLASRLKG